MMAQGKSCRDRLARTGHEEEWAYGENKKTTKRTHSNRVSSVKTRFSRFVWLVFRVNMDLTTQSQFVPARRDKSRLLLGPFRFVDAIDCEVRGSLRSLNPPSTIQGYDELSRQRSAAIKLTGVDGNRTRQEPRERPLNGFEGRGTHQESGHSQSKA